MTECALPGCNRNVSVSAQVRSSLYCRYHAQRRARHGSHWHGTYRSRELAPYVESAHRWLKQNRENPIYRATYWDLEYFLAASTRVVPATTLRGKSSKERSTVAFARLRAANVPTRRLIAIYLGVAALIEDDFFSHRTREFRIVQAAKAVHRLASGTHRKWDVWDLQTGGTRPAELHVYPRSSGYVLRKIGERLEKACDELAHAAQAEIIAMRIERFGPHPSHPPIANAS